MQGAELVRLLSAALAPHLPPRFDVVADGTALCLSDSGIGVSVVFLDDEYDNLGEMVVRVIAALSSVQDDVVLRMASVWPPSTEQSSRSRLPLPDARLNDDLLAMWYGDEKSPDLLLTPIQVS